MKERRNLLVPLLACALVACGDGGAPGNPTDGGDTVGGSDADAGIGSFDIEDRDEGQPDSSDADAGDATEPDADAEIPDSGDADADPDTAPDDADSVSDGETDGDADADPGPPDGGPSLTPPTNPTSVTAGGAIVSSTSHRGRILVGGTQPAGRLMSTNHQGFIAIGTPLLTVPAPSGGE
jgi:hypothetical protein